MKRYASSAAAQSGWKRAGRIALLPSESERESKGGLLGSHCRPGRFQ
jgi:hypothetical protein